MYYKIEAERFDKDFAVIDKKVREQVYNKKDDKLSHLREERYQRDLNKWEHLEKNEKKEENRLQTRTDLY